MAALARWCYRHRLVVLLLWVGALFGLGFVGDARAGTDYANVFSLPDTDSKRAYDLMEKAFPQRAGDTDTVVWKVDEGSVRDAAVRSRIRPALDGDREAWQGVGEVAGPYGAEGAAQISRGRADRLRQGHLHRAGERRAQGAVRGRRRHGAEAAERDGLQVELGGQAIQRVQEPPDRARRDGRHRWPRPSSCSSPSARSSRCCCRSPSRSSASAPACSRRSCSATSPTSPTWPRCSATLIGLGVGIDYALFIVTRHREASCAARTPEEAAVERRQHLRPGGAVRGRHRVHRAARHAGAERLQLPRRRGIAASADRRPDASLAAVTLLPALLGFLGMRVLSRTAAPPAGGDGPASREPPSGLAARWSAFVERRPASCSPRVAAGRDGCPRAARRSRCASAPPTRATTRRRTTTRQAYDLLAEGFGPGFNGPLRWSRTPAAPTNALALDRLLDAPRASPRRRRGTPRPCSRASRSISGGPDDLAPVEATDRADRPAARRRRPAAERGTRCRSTSAA